MIDTKNVNLDKIKNKNQNHWNEDIISESLGVNDALFNSNSVHNNLFKVKAIIKK
jgi:hypothetical protein